MTNYELLRTVPLTEMAFILRYAVDSIVHDPDYNACVREVPQEVCNERSCVFCLLLRWLNEEALVKDDYYTIRLKTSTNPAGDNQALSSCNEGLHPSRHEQDNRPIPSGCSV